MAQNTSHNFCEYFYFSSQSTLSSQTPNHSVLQSTGFKLEENIHLLRHHGPCQNQSTCFHIALLGITAGSTSTRRKNHAILSLCPTTENTKLQQGSCHRTSLQQCHETLPGPHLIISPPSPFVLSNSLCNKFFTEFQQYMGLLLENKM